MREILSIAADGTVTSFAGLAGVRGYADGVGSSARFSLPAMMTVAPTTSIRPNLLIMLDHQSWNASAIRTVTPSGRVTTISGSPGAPNNVVFAGSRDGPINQAVFGSLGGPALDAVNDVLYFSDFDVDGRSIVRALFNILSGINMTVRSLNIPLLQTPTFGIGGGMDFDPGRSLLYIVTQFDIVAVNVSSSWFGNQSAPLSATAIAGCGKSSTDSSPASGTSACFSSIDDVKLSADGNLLFVSDHGTSRIRTIDLDHDYYTDVLVGKGDSKSGIVLGLKSIASVPEPSWLAVDSTTKDLIVNVHWSAAVLRVTLRGTVSIVSTPEIFMQDGNGLDARFGKIAGMSFDKNDNLYVTDESEHVIRMVSPHGAVTTVAGTGEDGSASEVAATLARFSAPTGITVNPATGVVYISDTGNNQLRAYDPAKGIIKRFAGTGIPGTADGAALTKASFKQPGQLAFFRDPELGDTVYVLDSINADYFFDIYQNTSRKPPSAGDFFRRVIKGVVDTPAANTIDDGGLPFNFNKAVSCITVDTRGVVYFSDYWNSRIVRWTRLDGATLFFRKIDAWPGGLLFDNTGSLPSLLVAEGLTDLGSFARISLADRVMIWNSMSIGVGSMDGILIGPDASSSDGTFSTGEGHLTASLFAADSSGSVFIAHHLNGKIMRLGPLSGDACNFKTSNSATHPAGPARSSTGLMRRASPVQRQTQRISSHTRATARMRKAVSTTALRCLLRCRAQIRHQLFPQRLTALSAPCSSVLLLSCWSFATDGKASTSCGVGLAAAKPSTCL